MVPWQTPSKKSAYEQALIRTIRREVKTGDSVTVVGGGNGISSVAAAKQAGPSGTVRVYEGSEERTEIIRNVFDINDVSNRCEISHGVVGPSISVEGNDDMAESIDPRSLAECDILELDCEGSEVTILKEMNIRPRIVIVETHAHFDAPAALVREILNERGYSVTHEAIDDPTRGIKILTAVRK
ncbi:hypothetical protein G3I44_07930 [Halogeometricum borinquense]|uniref:Methyltransferase FkbM domain-containing protein n=1 Tax=Halogeometricum borinquense TaxID=60847 RepID=A0A6C0UG89_9EURY|nr:FkbM family methyltransferase [Halogeometricum borinquense]QIB74230.1 hypothetical protein G3I44_07930 [Halogeometricum borinquense]